MSRPIHWCPTCGYKVIPDTAYPYRPETELISEEDYYYGLVLCPPCGKAFVAIPYEEEGNE